MLTTMLSFPMKDYAEAGLVLGTQPLSKTYICRNYRMILTVLLVKI